MAEEKEEKEGIEWGELFGHAIRFMILKKSGTGNNNGPKIIDNSKNKVGIK